MQDRKSTRIIICVVVIAFHLPFFVLLATGPPEVLHPLKVIEVGLPPSERSVVILAVTTNQAVQGWAEGNKQLSQFIYDPMSKRAMSSRLYERRDDCWHYCDSVTDPNSGAHYSFLNEFGEIVLFNRQVTKGTNIGQVAGTRPFEKD